MSMPLIKLFIYFTEGKRKEKWWGCWKYTRENLSKPIFTHGIVTIIYTLYQEKKVENRCYTESAQALISNNLMTSF